MACKLISAAKLQKKLMHFFASAFAIE